MADDRPPVSERDERNTRGRWLRDLIASCVLVPALLQLADYPPTVLIAGSVVALALLKTWEYRREIWKQLHDRIAPNKKAAAVAGIVTIACLSGIALGGWYWVHRSPDGYTWGISENRNVRLPTLPLAPVFVADPNSLNLKDFLDLDFATWFRTTDKLKVTSPAGSEFDNVEFRMMYHPAIGTKFVGLYVAQSPNTFEICKSFAFHYSELMEKQRTLILKMHMPGDSRSMDSEDMRFTGDAFLYLETPITDEQKTVLNAIFKKQGVSEVSYRGQDWLLLDRAGFTAQMQKLHREQPTLKPNYNRSP